MKNKKSIFLSGKSGIGKSTLIRDLLEKTDLSISGFYVVRHKINSASSPTGYSMHEYSSLEPPLNFTIYGEKTPPLFLDFSKKLEERTDHKLLTSFGGNLREKIMRLSPKLVLLDEIGGAELLNEEFSGFIYWVLENFNTIGVIKEKNSFKALKKPSLTAKLDELYDFLQLLGGEVINFGDRKTMQNEKGRIENFLSSLY